jgi:hypothetical protein
MGEVYKKYLDDGICWRQREIESVLRGGPYTNLSDESGDRLREGFCKHEGGGSYILTAHPAVPSVSCLEGDVLVGYYAKEDVDFSVVFGHKIKEQIRMKKGEFRFAVGGADVYPTLLSVYAPVSINDPSTSVSMIMMTMAYDLRTAMVKHMNTLAYVVNKDFILTSGCLWRLP